MKRSSNWFVFFAFLGAAGAFVLYTGHVLPGRVASHFASSGHANSFMSRDGYIAFMLAFVVVLPGVMSGFMTLIFRSTTASINIPNRGYWLAPARRDATVAFLTRHGMILGAVVSTFLCFVHWLVVKANSVQPPQLANYLMQAGLAGLLVVLIVWTAWLWAAFRVPGAR